MHERSGVSAIVLAAGMSTRMGSVKQLLPFGGKPLLEVVLDNVRRSRVDEIVLVLGFSSETIRHAIPLDEIKVVLNDAYREGMGTSVRAGISHVSSQADAALVVLADQPFIKSDTIDQLIRAYREHNPQIVIPAYQGFRGNPILLDRSVFPELIGLGGDIGCRAIFGRHSDNILKVAVEDIGVLLDVDTQADLETLQQALTQGQLGSELLECADLSGREVDGKPQLIVVGQEPVAKTLVSLGRLMNFTVTVVDPLLSVNQAPGADRILHTLELSRLRLTGESYVVVASRGRFDEEAVEQALDADFAYVALVANRKRAEEILGNLANKGAVPEKLAKLRSPAGIDIGADRPEEIALSIMAEIIAERRRSHRTR